MKRTIYLLGIVFIHLTSLALGQDVDFVYNRDEAKCMTLVTNMSNVLILNEISVVDYHFNGYRREQLELRGDSSVTITQNPDLSFAKVHPTKDTFELYIFDSILDSLLFTQAFVAIKKSELDSFKGSISLDNEYCDYIVALDRGRSLNRSTENSLTLRFKNYDSEKISFKISNGSIKKSDPKELIVIPGVELFTTIEVFYEDKKILSREFIVW